MMRRKKLADYSPEELLERAKAFIKLRAEGYSNNLAMSYAQIGRSMDLKLREEFPEYVMAVDLYDKRLKKAPVNPALLN